jgi:UDP-glucuronate 4-epimerase
MKALVTGAAGFIGFHLAARLSRDGFEVSGLDNLNEYYDVNLKKARLEQLRAIRGFSFQLLDLADSTAVARWFSEHRIDYVVHLAAQAGVRYSLANPLAYVNSNVLAFVNLLEGCVRSHIKHLVFASSSSVYGANTKIPFQVSDPVDHPVSLYAATKKANELIAHSYSHLYGLPATGLRFFTVYGPWGRPDMAYYKFAQAIDEEEAIEVYNGGDMRRDFTYIDDVVQGLKRVMVSPPCSTLSASTAGTSLSKARYRIYNLGNHQPVDLLRFIEVIEKAFGKKAKKAFLPMQAGDVPCTYADVEELDRDFGFRPTTTIEEGLPKFVEWYRKYTRVRRVAA